MSGQVNELSLTRKEPFTLEMLKSVKKDDLIKLHNEFSTWNMTDQNVESIDMFLYHGFDPKIMAQHIFLVRKDYQASGKSDAEFKKDLFLLINLAVIKGSINENNIKGMEEKGREIARNLISTWRKKQHVWSSQ